MNLYVLTNQTSSISSWHFLSDLPQGALKLSQEVRFFWSAVFAVDVVHFKPEFLHRLEVVVEDDALGKLRIQAVLDFLRSPNLTQETVKKKRNEKKAASHYKSRSSPRATRRRTEIAERSPRTSEDPMNSSGARTWGRTWRRCPCPADYRRRCWAPPWWRSLRPCVAVLQMTPSLSEGNLQESPPKKTNKKSYMSENKDKHLV